MSALVATEHLCRRYRSGGTWIDALTDLTVQIQPGEQVAITGPSGSGKSTLLALMGGLERPTSGLVRFDNRDLASLDARALARYRQRDVAFVFQAFRLFPHLSALENVALPGLIAGMAKHRALERADELLERVGLSSRRTHHPPRLSAGEQQRVAAARALMNAPRLLLADEPTGNLDAASAAALLDLLDTFRHEWGLTIVVATHSLEVARRADRAITLRAGRVSA